MTEKAQGGCKQLDRISEGGAEGLKGDSRGEAKELDGFGRERGRLGGTIHIEGHLELCRANGDEVDFAG